MKTGFEISTSNIIELRGHTRYGRDYGFLLTDNYKLRDGRVIQVLYDQQGKLVTVHEKIAPLAEFFQKAFIPAKLDGADCLINIVNQ